MVNRNKGSSNSIRQEIQKTHLILIIVVTIFLSGGGTIINVNSNDKAFDQNLQSTAELISRLYSFSTNMTSDELRRYFNSVSQELPEVDVISIINLDNIRIYHTNNSLIGTQYNGTAPNLHNMEKGFYTEDDIGPSGAQRRTYSPVYNEEGQYIGFILTVILKTSIRSMTIRTIALFFAVTLIAIIFEIIISGRLSKHISMLMEDLSGTKYLVDSMRANNHDFTNKLHVILGLIQIGEYDKAVSYIENISIIQRETLSRVMQSVDNSSVAALLIGKIARASECNVRFILKDGICYKNSDVQLPSEALVTIIGNIIDNALDAMNINAVEVELRELVFGIFTKPNELLITVDDTGPGIPEENKELVFENGFSTKGTGRGVGLYHTKQLVESLGGNISFESQIGAGTSFIVTFKK